MGLGQVGLVCFKVLAFWGGFGPSGIHLLDFRRKIAYSNHDKILFVKDVPAVLTVSQNKELMRGCVLLVADCQNVNKNLKV